VGQHIATVPDDHTGAGVRELRRTLAKRASPGIVGEH
jgi:hypothetical protein